MNKILSSSIELLSDHNFSAESKLIANQTIVVFETPTILGFIFEYESVESLIEQWSRDADNAVRAFQFGLRKSGRKAWNTYSVFLTSSHSSFASNVRLGAIEEDLNGTRKIARAGVQSHSDLVAALLPLMPIQNAPHLEPVDIREEIRQRTTELPRRAVQAFLSQAEDSVVLQILEETP